MLTLPYRFIWLIALLITSLSVLSQDDRLQIVASHSILGDVVSNVVGDVADVMLLMPAGIDPHAFKPTPSDLTAIAQVDVVFVNGAFFEEGLLELIENAGEDVHIVEASACVEIIPFGIDRLAHDSNNEEEHDAPVMSDMEGICDNHIAELDRYADNQTQAETRERLYEIDCGQGDNHDTHTESSCDPHVWMNPNNVMFWVMLIRDTLIELDPANTDTYRANADTYLDELDRLVDTFIIPLVETLPEENRILIASHDSLGYLTTTFGFETVGTIMQGGSTLAEPSVQDIVKIIDLVRAKDVPAIFGETSISDTIIQTIADETGVELIILYSGSLSGEDGSATTYIEYIRYNYSTIIEALGGGA